MSQPGQQQAAPIIKYVGGKTRLLSELLKRAPQTYGRYYEPFVGGGALFFRLAPERAVLNDSNYDLMHLYEMLQTAGGVDYIIERLRHHRDSHSETHYYEVRKWWNGDFTKDGYDAAAALIYLNKTCFNGLWRVNKKGDFNVPMGRYKNPKIYDPDALRAAGRALANATLRCRDYRDAVGDAKPGDFIYFDSPYDPTTETSNFTNYTKDAFGRQQQTELADTTLQLVDRGCKVMLSNNDTPFVRSLYEGFKIDTVKCGRSINSNASKRGAVDEVIICGGY